MDNEREINKRNNEKNKLENIFKKLEGSERLTPSETFFLEYAIYNYDFPEKTLVSLKKKFYDLWFFYTMRKKPDLKWITNPYDALNFYKSEYGYRLLNSVLRGVKPINIPVSNEKIWDIIRMIDSKMNKKQQGIQVFRGVNKSDFFDIIPNSFYTEDGYSSTSTDFCISKRFSPVCCIFSFEIPKNILSYDFSNHDKSIAIMTFEKEILLEKKIEYHIGQPVTIQESIFYPCVIMKRKKGEKREGKKNKGLVERMKKQTEYLLEFKKKLIERTPEELLEIIEKYMIEEKKTTEEIQKNFYGLYGRLCLEKKLFDKVYTLFFEKYGNKPSSPSSSSYCIIS